MKVRRYELARAIDKVKSIVQKNDAFPALGGVLVKDGYITASNTEISIQVKLEAAEGIPFILPMRAFDLVKNLPEGELEIECNSQDVVTIRTGKIRNTYQSYPADQFVMEKQIPGGPQVTLPGGKLMRALSKVVFAAADKPDGRSMHGVCLEASDGFLNIVATDGHVVAWDAVPAEGLAEMNMIIPKATVRKLVSMDMDNDVTVSFDEGSAVFVSDEYTIFTRLIEGPFVAFKRIFQTDAGIPNRVDRKEIFAALQRAKLCCQEEMKPVVIEMHDGRLNLQITDSLTDYQEELPVAQEGDDIRIGFNSKLLLESLKVFEGDEVSLSFGGPKAPVFISEEGQDIRILTLPVAIH